jgi:hypothetical protein
MKVRKSPSRNSKTKAQLPQVSAKDLVSSDSSRLSVKENLADLPTNGMDKYPASCEAVTTKSLPVDEPEKEPLMRITVPLANRRTACVGDLSSRSLSKSETASAREEMFMFILQQFDLSTALLYARCVKLY